MTAASVPTGQLNRLKSHSSQEEKIAVAKQASFGESLPNEFTYDYTKAKSEKQELSVPMGQEPDLGINYQICRNYRHNLFCSAASK